MRAPAARILPLSTNQTGNNTPVVGGPVRLRGWSFNDGNPTQELLADTSVAAPAAGATIASLTLANGFYQVQWWFELTGTPGAGDVDNVALFDNAVQIDQSVNLGAVGNYGPFNTQLIATGGSSTLAAKAIGAATAGTTYRVKIVATPQINSKATIFDGGMAIAFIVIPPDGVDNRWFGEQGIMVETGLSVSGTRGTLNGLLWYNLESDYSHWQQYVEPSR